MLGAMLFSVMLSGVEAETRSITCEFPGRDSAEKRIIVTLEPRPSLKDQPGKFRVIMDLNERVTVRAAAAPITSTEERDILIRGITRKKSMYTIGLRDDGAAALNMQTKKAGAEEVTKSTRTGTCRGFDALLEKWLPS